MGIYKEKQDQKLVPIYKFICLNFLVHCKNFTPIPFTFKLERIFFNFPRSVEDAVSAYKRGQLINFGLLKSKDNISYEFTFSLREILRLNSMHACITR